MAGRLFSSYVVAEFEDDFRGDKRLESDAVRIRHHHNTTRICFQSNSFFAFLVDNLGSNAIRSSKSQLTRRRFATLVDAQIKCLKFTVIVNCPTN